MVSKQTLFNYICGTLNSKTKEALEDDFDFMLAVFKQTKDSNHYDNCSMNLKLNHKFIEELIILFQDDLFFVDRIVNNYLVKYAEYTPYCYDIFALITKLYPNNLETTYLKERLALYYKKIVASSIIVSIENEIDSIFFIIDYYLEDATYLKEFFAINLLDILLNEDDFLNNKIRSKSTTQYLLNLIRNKDYLLADYFSNHIKLLNPLVEDLEQLKSLKK